MIACIMIPQERAISGIREGGKPEVASFRFPAEVSKEAEVQRGKTTMAMMPLS